MLGGRMIEIRKRVRGLNALVSGSPLILSVDCLAACQNRYPKKNGPRYRRLRGCAVVCASLSGNLRGRDSYEPGICLLIQSDVYSLQTYYMGMVDSENRVAFYDGEIRIIDPHGTELEKFVADGYLDHLEERVDSWSYMKTLYLKDVGWHGLRDGKGSGLYRVGPLARLNAAAGMATPLAQREYERMFASCGEKPVHNTLVYHWARLIEVLFAAERMMEIASDDQLTDPEIRNIPARNPDKGVGICEAPRGTLIHHYETDEEAILNR